MNEWKRRNVNGINHAVAHHNRANDVRVANAWVRAGRRSSRRAPTNHNDPRRTMTPPLTRLLRATETRMRHRLTSLLLPSLRHADPSSPLSSLEHLATRAARLVSDNVSFPLLRRLTGSEEPRPAFAFECIANSSNNESASPAAPLLERLLEQWNQALLAAPKRRVSHSRKRQRSLHKWLTPVESFKTCGTCNKPHPHHHLCPHCFPFAGNYWKTKHVPGTTARQRAFERSMNNNNGKSSSSR